MLAGMSIDFWRVSGAELAHPRPGGVPFTALWTIRVLNLVFNLLNALWFSKMLRGAIKVRNAPFSGPELSSLGLIHAPRTKPLMVLLKRVSQSNL
jgi:hypothetical protein